MREDVTLLNVAGDCDVLTVGERLVFRVLLVEPSEAERQRMVTLTSRCLPTGSDVEAVHSAEDALIRIKSNEYNLIIAENRLPGLSGTDLLLFLRRYAPDALRVLVTSSTQVSFLKRAQATAEPDLVVVRTGDEERWCGELHSLLVKKGLVGASTDVETGQAASPAASRKAH